MKLIRISLFFLIVSLPGILLAQNAIITRGGTLVGTIQTLDQGVGLVIISGRRYGYDDDLLSVYYDGESVDSIILEQGLVVRYLVNANQIVTQMELLGPNDKIQAFFEH